MDWRGFYFVRYGLEKKLGNQWATVSPNHPPFSGRTAQANPSGQNQTAPQHPMLKAEISAQVSNGIYNPTRLVGGTILASPTDQHAIPEGPMRCR
jgi:hypothetical protein